MSVVPLGKLLVKRLVKLSFNKVVPGASKEATKRAVKTNLTNLANRYESKASKAYLENKPKRDTAMLQMADKITKDIKTLFGKK